MFLIEDRPTTTLAPTGTRSREPCVRALADEISLERRAMCEAPHRAEFERQIIRERKRLGLAKARQARKRLGRPPLQLPDRARVARLHAKGSSWREIAAELRCSVWAARRAATAASDPRVDPGQ